jgi:hypothetical protein
MSRKGRGIERRGFLKQAALGAAGGVLAAGGLSSAEAASRTVSILVAPDDAVAAALPARWAVGQLREALGARGIPTRLVSRMGEVGPGDLCLAAGGKMSSFVRAIAVPDSAEAFAIGPGPVDARDALLVRASDVRGLVYALTELADAVALADEPWAALNPGTAVQQRPANAVRSCMRMFCSDVEDKGWFRDRDFWKRYLSMLAAQRFNRFNLSFGLGYDFPREIRDAYLHFAYPFLMKVPGYDVRATNLGDAERDANMETLRFISDETAARGLHFQLGLWTHAYVWEDSPDANHRIEGLTPDTQGPYCRDALGLLLKECPSIGGVTIRTHGESGVAEGSYDLWRMIFDGVARCGRTVEIDLHAKGLDARMIDTALASGQPVVVSPKFWAEHMGLPYHQAWIRPTELPQRAKGEGLFALSSGERSFLRYGYGDLLAEDRRYGVLHRIWPGTQRMLVWGDPAFAAAYGREASFCGTQGVELMEPLSFKGRKGSGHEGSRTAYAETALVPRDDYEKYLYSYRLWGRLLYDPDAAPESWRRLLRAQHGAAAPAVETTLASASRILPLLTTAHAPSAANNHWWPEMAVNMSIVDASHPEPFTDTPSPRRFGAVSALDPQLFASVDDFAADLLAARSGARYTPAEVAASLRGLATAAAASVAEARRRATSARPDLQRVLLDAAVTIDLGRFFAAKLAAAVLYALFERAGDRRFLSDALETYADARAAWVRIVATTRDAYVADVSYGIGWYQRGHWADRLAAIDEDGVRMQEALAKATAVDRPAARYRDLRAAVLGATRRAAAEARHDPPRSFRPGQPLPLEIAAPEAAAAPQIHYRHVNQAEAWQVAALRREASVWAAVVPGDYTASTFPLQYYFDWHEDAGSRPVLLPGFDANWSNRPYFVVRREGA